MASATRKTPIGEVTKSSPFSWTIETLMKATSGPIARSVVPRPAIAVAISA